MCDFYNKNQHPSSDQYVSEPISAIRTKRLNQILFLNNRALLTVKEMSGFIRAPEHEDLNFQSSPIGTSRGNCNATNHPQSKHVFPMLYTIIGWIRTIGPLPGSSH